MAGPGLFDVCPAIDCCVVHRSAGGTDLGQATSVGPNENPRHSPPATRTSHADDESVEMPPGCLYLVSLTLLSGLAWAAGEGAKPGLDNAECLSCHDGKSRKLELIDAQGKPRPMHAVTSYKYGQSVHAKMQCVACHSAITDNPAEGASHSRTRRNPPRPPAALIAISSSGTRRRPTTRPPPSLAWASSSPTSRPTASRSTPARRKTTSPRCSPPATTATTRTASTSRPSRTRRTRHGGSKSEVVRRVVSHRPVGNLHRFGSRQKVLGRGEPNAAICSDCHTSHSIGNTSAGRSSWPSRPPAVAVTRSRTRATRRPITAR